ncbi:MAG TPA: hypothetical protein VMH61_08625 [Candidatus Acidoferrales bacterium]|nr:hypothetical protein [Candidatus Acidoferrales bacterium]
MSAAVTAATGRTARRIALAALVVFALTGGGRVTGSDEVTMLDLSRALLHGHLDVPPGATLDGPDGRHYTKNTAGQAVLALPLAALAELGARAAHLPSARTELGVRFIVSFFNGLVTAILLGVFYALARRLGAGPGAALGASALLGFTTPLWFYAKSFMSEPLEALGLLLALGNAALASAGGAQERPGERRAQRLAALGAFVAIAVKPSMVLLALAALSALGAKRVQRWIVPLAGVALGLAAEAAYNFACFGNALHSGYGAQASLGAFSTPLFVGLYGLLVSSGKGVLWFAPAVVLAVPGFVGMRRPRAHSHEPRHGLPARNAARAALVACAVALAEFGTFQHWAGDGSWGPRFLVPVLPLAFLAVAFALEGASRARRRVAWALGLAGLVVTLGGVGIHFGAEMRQVGDYPYTRALDDPHFMEASHFNPRYSPIAVHWQMLSRNLAAQLHGQAPRLGHAGAVDPRLGISTGDQRALLGAIDVWWLYARYAGLPAVPLALAAVLLLAAAIATIVLARRAAAAEESRAA